MSQLLQKIQNITRLIYSQSVLSSGERLDVCERGLERIQEMERDQKSLIVDLNSKVDTEIAKACDSICRHLQNPAVISQVSTWQSSQCPHVRKKSKLQEVTNEHAVRRVQNHINAWENENEVFLKVQKTLFKMWEETFQYVKCKLDQFQGNMVSGMHEDMADESKSSDRLGTVLMALSSPVWVPVGLVVGLFALPAIGIKCAVKQVKKMSQFKQYEQDSPSYMYDATERIMAQIVEGEIISEIFTAEIRKISFIHKALTKELPNLIAAEKLMCLNMIEEITNERTLDEGLHDLIEHANDIFGRLSLFNIANIKVFNIGIKQLELSGGLASGTYGEVRMATYCKSEEEMPIEVAVKVLKGRLTEEMASEFVLEEECLRLVIITIRRSRCSCLSFPNGM